MVIEAPELQTEVQGLLKNTTKLYMEILEEIHADYRSQKAGEDIRGVLGDSTTASTLSRHMPVEKTKSKREIDVEKGLDIHSISGQYQSTDPSGVSLPDKEVVQSLIKVDLLLHDFK